MYISNWVPQKLPQICTVIVCICIGKIAWFTVYICDNIWNACYIRLLVSRIRIQFLKKVGSGTFHTVVKNPSKTIYFLSIFNIKRKKIVNNKKPNLNEESQKLEDLRIELIKSKKKIQTETDFSLVYSRLFFLTHLMETFHFQMVWIHCLKQWSLCYACFFSSLWKRNLITAIHM